MRPDFANFITGLARYALGPRAARGARRQRFVATVRARAARSGMKLIVASIAFVSTIVCAHAAWASCRISNTTKWDFTIESGNTSNQRVGPNTTTSIAAGRIKGVDKKSGKSISGTCKDGDALEIKDDGGIPVLL